MAFRFEVMGGKLPRNLFITAGLEVTHVIPSPPLLHSLSITGTLADHLSLCVPFSVEHAATAFSHKETSTWRTQPQLTPSPKYLLGDLLQQLYSNILFYGTSGCDTQNWRFSKLLLFTNFDFEAQRLVLQEDKKCFICIMRRLWV